MPTAAQILSKSASAYQPQWRRPLDWDLSGRVFGQLSVLSFAGLGSGHLSWFCKCSCGAHTQVSGRNLRSGNTKSCGCHRREVLKRGPQSLITHGHSAGSQSPTYQSWTAMHQRCGNPSTSYYPRYGGRGIKVCERWLKYENFLADMGERPEGKTLDRHPDNNGNYELANCRWATRSEQNRNMRTTIWVSLYGARTCFTEACQILGISRRKAFDLKKQWKCTPQETVNRLEQRTASSMEIML